MLGNFWTTFSVFNNFLYCEQPAATFAFLGNFWVNKELDQTTDQTIKKVFIKKFFIKKVKTKDVVLSYK